MPLPWLIGAALIGVATAVASSSSTERSDNSDALKRKKEREEKEEKNEEIESFKEASTKMIKNKYKVDISFTGNKLEVQKDDTSKSKVLKKHLETLKSENKNMEILIKKLEDTKNVI